MRVFLPIILGLSMFVCIMADDFLLGEREQDDFRVFNREIVKRENAWQSIITFGIKAPGKGGIVTQVKISTLEGEQPDCEPIKGNVGTRFVVIMCKGKDGQGYRIRVEGYAKNMLRATPEPTLE